MYRSFPTFLRVVFSCQTFINIEIERFNYWIAEASKKIRFRAFFWKRTPKWSNPTPSFVREIT